MPSKPGSLFAKGRNARKMADRKIARLQKDLKRTTDKNARVYMQREIARQQELKQKTYKKGNPISAIKNAINRIRSSSIGRTLFSGDKSAVNFVTEQLINEASRREFISNEETPGYTRIETKAFYRATQKIWQGKAGNRNQLIMDYLGVDTLQSAFDIVLSHPKIKAAIEMERFMQDKSAHLTDEQRELYEELLSGDTDNTGEGSPDYLIYVIQFDPDKPWSEQ